MTQNLLNQDLQNCIEECNQCANICLQTATSYCLKVGHNEQNHLRLMLDCSEICQTSAHFMLRQSPLHIEVCRICAKVCEECARSCHQFADDEAMQKCANICKSCANECRQMTEKSKEFC